MKTIEFDGKYNFPNGANKDPLFRIAEAGNKDGILTGRNKSRMLYRILTDPDLRKQAAAALADYLGESETHAIEEKRREATPYRAFTVNNVRYGLFHDDTVKAWREPVKGPAYWQTLPKGKAEYINASSFASKDSLEYAIAKHEAASKDKRKERAAATVKTQKELKDLQKTVAQLAAAVGVKA